MFLRSASAGFLENGLASSSAALYGERNPMLAKVLEVVGNPDLIIVVLGNFCLGQYPDEEARQ